MISTSTSDFDGESAIETKGEVKYETIEFLELSKIIKEIEVENLLKSSILKIILENIGFKDLEIKEENSHYQTIRLKVESDLLTLTKLEVLKKEKFPGHEDQKINIKYMMTLDEGLTINCPKPDDVIEYPYEYHRMVVTDFERKEGSEGLIFKNKEIIEKQRAVMGYLIKKMGSNLLSGLSIMNVSLPINIFDVRSHLEVFCSQTCYAPLFLESAGKTNDALESLKLTTTFALTTVHLAVAQLKPFNPILGETFQVKIGDSHFYIEQTSHHPPIFNFLIIGKNFKVFGYNESEIGSGPNSIKAKYKGSYTIKFDNGREHKVYFPEFKLSGTLFGNRSIKYYGNMIVTDTTNDLISFITMDPDDRGFFKKMFSKKSCFPDYFKGVMTLISKNVKFNKKDNTYSIVDMNKHVLSNIEGEFTQFIKFDGKSYWEYESTQHPEFRRMNLTLPSDCMFREDINWLRARNEGQAQKAKIKLEDIQRNDKKLREKEKKSK